ncbi:hypothetical protein DASC09_060310 [Saccharomycopsis crataegensis]|uniref:Uncharacterized protein n=1 Tax=Saccharomycopsis crataegensis TaxID=43959 RepID=A0AAV5QW76_9ASCO|nr:hypothetical protein DASC09_060310 [Saccharomycopsis crataegensis]
MSSYSQVNSDDLEKRLTNITSLTKQLSKISSNDDAGDFATLENLTDEDTTMMDEFSATKYWKNYHDYFSKLSTIKKEINEFKNMKNEYTGGEDFEAEKYHHFNDGLDKAIKNTNKSYKDFNGIDYDYFK